MSADAVPAALEAVRARVAAAASACGRGAGEVTLVAVSKLQPEALIRAAYACGQRDFGENYVQELLRKRDALADLDGVRWHLIGHLQSNKARHVAPFAHLVHTVDDARLGAELGRRALAAGRVQEVLAQVNVGGEAQKSGCAPEGLPALLDALSATPGISLRGLMTVPPHTDDPAGARPYFDALREMRDAQGGAARLPTLSMGMTHDLEVAVAAGATVVRVGTAIFGARG
ncbi:MAG: YggS family pyridoxal phosphate-dependent enzyme [Polyangiales bacterium]